jgi:hypothetical protein
MYKVALLDDFYVVDKVMLNIHLSGVFRRSPGSPPPPLFTQNLPNMVTILLFVIFKI